MLLSFSCPEYDFVIPLTLISVSGAGAASDLLREVSQVRMVHEPPGWDFLVCIELAEGGGHCDQFVPVVLPGN
jgi:hypothetical protein